MELTKLSKGQKGVVKGLKASGALKQRLFSLGIVRGATIEVVDCSLSKATIEVKIGNTLVALRDSEAKDIEVEAQ